MKQIIAAYEKYLSKVSELTFTNLSLGIGTNIHAKGVGLGYALTNPTLTNKYGKFHSESYFSEGTYSYRKLFKSKKLSLTGMNIEFIDAENAYQLLKTGNHKEDNAIMFIIIINKFVSYPELYERVNQKGGLKYLLDCIHQPVKSKDWYYTNGSNGFMKILVAAYLFIQDNI